MSEHTNPSIDGINNVEIVPPLRQPRVLDRLRHIGERSDCLRAAIAYWCIDPDKISDRIIPLLSGDGFLCADIHLPTDIDILYEMKAAGANVYLHLLHPNPQPGDLKRRVPEYLLHPKTLLFDQTGGTAELWVGSHNWTNRALSGLNIEASLVCSINRDAPLYLNALGFLEGIRSLCIPFDLSSRAYYKWLQKMPLGDDPVWVLEVQGELAPHLSSKRLTVFEASEAQYKNLNRVDKDLIVAARESASARDFLYRATIMDTGRVKRAGVAFDSRVHGYHAGTDRTTLVGPSIPAASDISQTFAWATVEIQEPLPSDMALFERPPSDPWQVSKEDVFENRVAQEDRLLFLKPGKPLICRPVPQGKFEGEVSEQVQPSKRKVGHQLVRRMVVRKLE